MCMCLDERHIYRYDSILGHLLLIIVSFVIVTERNIAFDTSNFNETVLQTSGGKIIATVHLVN